MEHSMNNQSAALNTYTESFVLNNQYANLQNPFLQASAHAQVAHDVLLAIAILGLVGSIVDGKVDQIEIEEFTKCFRNDYCISEREVIKIITVALRQLSSNNPRYLVNRSCNTINEHLILSQRLKLLDGFIEILIADGQIHKNEEYFLDYIVIKLKLVDALRANE
jgi:uncharacterized tellurite resistance protein B-like protein